MNRFYLWYSGFSDIPELMALEPAEAMKIVNAAQQVEYDATFWDQMSTRNVIRSFYVILALILLITAITATGLAPIARVLLGISALFIRPYAHRRNMNRLRPRIYEALKARQASSTA
jgi:hypothetical protein